MKQRLLDWYKKEGRKLPWRETVDAYKILVSEMMLQQTQVSRVLEYYSNWLKHFPNWQTLSKASNARVITVWSGLGYNRRALYLRDIARYLVEFGELRSLCEWQIMKGNGYIPRQGIKIYKRSGYCSYERNRRLLAGF